MINVSSQLDASVLGPEISLVSEDHPFRRELRSWLGDNSPGVAEPLDQDEKFEFRRAWQRKLFDAGWAGPAWPERFGGRGAGPLEQFMYYEEVALARAPWAVNDPGIVLLGPTLMVHGPDELRDRFLPGILSADEIWCQGFSEPDAGSDLASLRTKAVRDGDEWVIDGQKIWTTWAKYSEWCFALCRTEPGSERHRGLSLLIIRMDAPGIEHQPIIQISGDPEFSEVFFSGARTPADMIVGEQGNGWKVAMTMFGFERADQGFTDHGRMLVSLHDIKVHLKAAAAERVLSPAAIERARDDFAQLWIRAQQLRRFNLRLAHRQHEGQEIGPHGSVINLFWADLEKEVAELGARVLGARGLIEQTPSAHHLLASRAASIYSGTSEIQRNIVAERMLGLPR